MSIHDSLLPKKLAKAKIEGATEERERLIVLLDENFHIEPIGKDINEGMCLNIADLRAFLESKAVDVQEPEAPMNHLKPSDALIESMCLRYDHSFGMPSGQQFMGIGVGLTDQQKDSIRSTMRQLWEEVAGVGFYKGHDTIATYQDQIAELEAKATPRPMSEWNEEDGPALWWRFPVVEPPYVGSPLDDDWWEGNHPSAFTHWTPITVPNQPETDAELGFQIGPP